MKKVKFLVTSVLSFMLLTSSVYAACNYEEKAKLNNESANVKANYEIKERELTKDEYTAPPDAIPIDEQDSYVPKTEYIEVNILNLIENLYVTVKNDVTKDVKTYYYTDATNGNIKFNWNEIGSIVNYTIKVMASSSSDCNGQTLRTLYLTLPRYNEYSEYDVCDRIPDYYMCQRFVTYDDFKYDDFTENVTKEIADRNKKNEEKKENNKWYKKVGKFISDHKTAFIIGGISLVVVAGGATYIIIKKRRRSII